jgi:cysteine desulfurase
MTLSAHKIYGPKGVGGLFIRRGVKINPIIYGGGQGPLRSGTENVPATVGFAEALCLSEKNKKTETKRLKKLRDILEKGIFKSIPKVVLNGHPTRRLPNFLNVSILDIEGEAMLLYLDELGIMVGTGSACNSQSLEPSTVLTALGNPYEYIHGSLRFTLGKENTLEDIKYVLKHLPNVVKKLRAISPLQLKMNQKETMSNPKAFIGNQTPHFLRKNKLGKSK